MDGAAVIFLRYVGARQAAVALLPLGMLAIKLAQFEHGGVKVAFVAIRVSQVVADGSFLRRKPPGFAILGNRLVELILFVQSHGQVGMSFPEAGVQANGL